METQTETEDRKSFVTIEGTTYRIAPEEFEACKTAARLEREKERKEREQESRKKLRNTGIAALICGSLLATVLYSESKYFESLIPEQKRDRQVMMQNKSRMESYEARIGEALVPYNYLAFSNTSELQKSRRENAIAIYRKAMKLCPTESDIGKGCRERYKGYILDLEERISSLKKN